MKCTVQAKRLNDVKHLLTITKYQAHNVPTFYLTISLENLRSAALTQPMLMPCMPMYAHMFSVWFGDLFCEVLQINRSGVDSPPRVQAEYVVKFFRKKKHWLGYRDSPIGLS